MNLNSFKKFYCLYAKEAKEGARVTWEASFSNNLIGLLLREAFFYFRTIVFYITI